MTNIGHALRMDVQIFKYYNSDHPIESKQLLDKTVSDLRSTNVYKFGDVFKTKINLTQRFGHPDLWALFGRIYRKIPNLFLSVEYDLKLIENCSIVYLNITHTFKFRLCVWFFMNRVIHKN
eukprot:426107_1